MRIELLGTSFTVHTDEDPARLRDIIDFYRTKVQEIEGSVSTTDPLKIAILAGLLSTDELFKLRERLESAAGPADEAERIEAIADDLINTLDSTLEE
ncbi:MAG: cell division protein ZapA [Spirochaetaceae bacterium]